MSAGQTAVFNVAATGNLPLGYQWQFNGTNIPNATNSTLTITNASAGNAGSYSVIVAQPVRVPDQFQCCADGELSAGESSAAGQA